MNNLLSRIRNYGPSQDGVVTPIVVCALVGAVGFNLWHLFPETTGGGIPVNQDIYFYIGYFLTPVIIAGVFSSLVFLFLKFRKKEFSKLDMMFQEYLS